MDVQQKFYFDRTIIILIAATALQLYFLNTYNQIIFVIRRAFIMSKIIVPLLSILIFYFNRPGTEHKHAQVALILLKRPDHPVHHLDNLDLVLLSS
jgi:hypothetical protein